MRRHAADGAGCVRHLFSGSKRLALAKPITSLHRGQSTSCMSDRPGCPARAAPRRSAPRAARPPRNSGATSRLVAELDALAGAREDHRVLADDVAAAKCGEADRCPACARRCTPCRAYTALSGELRPSARRPRPRRGAAPCRTAHRPCAGDASRRSRCRSPAPRPARPARRATAAR